MENIIMFVVAGEALIDMVPLAQAAGGTAAFVPIEGGAPYNFARALALQGCRAAYANPLSEDRFGAQLLEGLQACGVQHLGSRVALPTALAFVATDAEGHAEYSFYRDGVADRALDAVRLLRHDGGQISGFHTGALALLPPDHDTALAALMHFRARGVLCSVDVNMRVQVARSMGVPPAAYQAAARAAAVLAHVVKVSEEDLRHLDAVGAPLDAARALLSAHCRLVVLTLGAAGAWALTATQQVFCAAPKVRVVDSVGAGDCFYAGFIAALAQQGVLSRVIDAELTRSELEFALAHASACAAVNLTRKGCAPPTLAEARAWQAH